MQLNTKIPKMAFPLILSNITVPLLGLANTIIAGHLADSDYLAAIGLGSMIFNFLYWGLGFFRMSSTGLIAQAYGARNQQEIHTILLHSIVLASMIGLMLIALQYPVYRMVLLFVNPDAPVLHLMKHYYFIRIWAAPAVLINFVIVGAMVAVQKPRGPLILLSITNFLAIILSVILVFSFHLNIIGIAIADIVAQYIGLLLGLMLLSGLFDLNKIWQQTRIQMTQLVTLLHANRDIFIRTLGIITVFSFFTIWSSHISPLVLAVNTLLMNFFQIMANALGGFDNVAEALAGEAVGKKNLNLFKKALLDVGAWASLFSLVITFLYGIFGEGLIDLMTNLATVRAVSYQYMPYVALLPIIAVASFLLDGIAIGANLFKQMRNGMIISVLLFFIVWWGLKLYGNLGLWISFYSFFIFRAIFLGYYILKFYRASRYSLGNQRQ